MIYSGFVPDRMERSHSPQSFRPGRPVRGNRHPLKAENLCANEPQDHRDFSQKRTPRVIRPGPA